MPPRTKSVAPGLGFHLRTLASTALEGTVFVLSVVNHHLIANLLRAVLLEDRFLPLSVPKDCITRVTRFRERPVLLDELLPYLRRQVRCSHLLFPRKMALHAAVGSNTAPAFAVAGFTA